MELKYMRKIGTYNITENDRINPIKIGKTNYNIPLTATIMTIEKTFVPKTKNFSCEIIFRNNTTQKTINVFKLNSTEQCEAFCNQFPKIKWEDKSLYGKEDNKQAA